MRDSKEECVFPKHISSMDHKKYQLFAKHMTLICKNQGYISKGENISRYLLAGHPKKVFQRGYHVMEIGQAF